MEELEFILSQRKIIQDKYLKEAKNVWTEFDGVEADRKHKKVYNFKWCDVHRKRSILWL